MSDIMNYDKKLELGHVAETFKPLN